MLDFALVTQKMYFGSILHSCELTLFVYRGKGKNILGGNVQINVLCN